MSESFLVSLLIGLVVVTQFAELYLIYAQGSKGSIDAIYEQYMDDVLTAIVRNDHDAVLTAYRSLTKFNDSRSSWHEK